MQILAAILTISDRSFQGIRDDLSGPALAKFAKEQGWIIAEKHLLPDERAEIEEYLIEKADKDGLDVVFTTGGTGFAPRDITPEATAAVIDRNAPGLMEAIRAESLKITPHAMLSRGISGIRNRTLIVNLSGSPRAAVEQISIIAPVVRHAVELLRESGDAEAGH